MRNPVTTRKLKFNGQAKRDWHGDLVDAVGDRWLVVYYVDPPHRTEAKAEITHCIRYFGLDVPLSVLVSFDALGQVLEYQCDAGLPAVVRGREISFIDLDLDIMADVRLIPRLRDEATFAQNQRSMAYPPEIAARAWEGVGLARELMEARACPFDGSAELLLGRILAAEGPL